MGSVAESGCRMKVGIISDTHGNLDGFLDAVELLRETHNVEKLYFLGHHYGDLDRVVEVKKALRAAKEKDAEASEFVSDLYEVLAQREGIAAPRTPRTELEDSVWLRKHTVRVPAEDDPEGMFGSEIGRTEFEVVGGRIVCLVHNPKTLTKEDIASCNIVLYGHSHLYQVDLVGGRYFCNPGHLMETDDQGRRATFAVLEVGDTPRFTVYDLDGEPQLDQTLDLEVKRKFSAS